MDERLHEVIVTAVRKSLHKSSEDIARQIVKDLEANHYIINKRNELDGSYVKVC